MASVDQIVTRLEDLSEDVCSEKVTLRNKGIDQVKQIFGENKIQGILSGTIPSTLTPKYLFSNVFNGLLKHASRQEQTQSQRADNKAPVFISIVQSLIDNCNHVEANRIPTSLIFDSVLSIFEDGFYARQYGVSFLNILVKYLSQPNHSNFFNVDKGLWKRLLNGCKEMCECGEGQRTNAIQCMVKILELGALYSYLPDVIVDFVPFAETLFVDAEKSGCANDVFTVGFLLTKILCVSYQYEMCLFSENVTHYMLKCYKSNLKEDVKSQIFEYLHLVMVIHEQLFENSTLNHYKKADWNALKDSIEKVVEQELNFLHEYKFSRDLDVLPDSLMACASYLYYLLIKKPSSDVHVISDEEENDDDVIEISPRSEKRIRTSSQFEKILHRIRPSDKKFVWRWFVILGSALHQRPMIQLPHNEITSLIRLCSQCIDDLSYERQFKALYRICQYLVSSDKEHTSTQWEDITQGIQKCATKYQSIHSIELLQYVLSQQLCSPKLILEIYNQIIATPFDEMNVRTLTLLYQTKEFREIIGDQLMDPDHIVNYLNSHGGLILTRPCFPVALEWVFICLNIPKKDFQKDIGLEIKSIEITKAEIDMKEIMNSLQVKAITSNCHTDKDRNHSIPPHIIRPPDINKTLVRKLFKSIFADAKQSQHISVIIELMLRQLEFTTRFLQELANVIIISEAGSLLDDIFVRFEGTLKALTKAFKSQISEDAVVINKLLEYLNYFLSVDYVKELKPVLSSSGFLLQVAIWTHHQFVASGTVAKALTDEAGTKNVVVKRNSLVFEIILRLGAIEEDLLKEYWFETEINSAIDIKSTFAILKKVPTLPSNARIVKLVIGELEDIFTSHHKNEKVSQMVLEILTELLVVFKDHPTTISDWDRFVKQYILWGCKQKYSPVLTIQLLEFYERFYETFSENHHLIPELQSYIADSFSLFIRSKNFRIQMKAAKVLVKICNTNQHVHAKNCLSLKTVIEYCQYVNRICTDLQWEELLEVDSVESEGRMVARDEIQNQKAVVHYLTCGIALNNESLGGYLMNILVKFYKRNPRILRDSNVQAASIVEEQIVYLMGSWLDKDLEIGSFPHFLTNTPTLEVFVRKYNVAIGMNFIRCRPWKDFVELCKKYNLESVKDVLADRFLIYNILPTHQLNNNANFNANMEQLVGPQDVPLTDLKSKLLLAMLGSLHDYYLDDNEFQELFHFQVPTIETIVDHFAINNEQYSAAVQALDSHAVRNREPFIVNVCMKYPHSILLIMSGFHGQIQFSKNLFSKLRNVQKLMKFSELIIKFIIRASDNALIDHYKEYFVKDIVLFLLTVTCEDHLIPNAVKVPLLLWVLQFIKRTVGHCNEMYKENLNRIAALLVDLAMENKEDLPLCETIAEVIKLFFVDYRQLFADTLDKIDILPEDHPSFEYVSTIQVGYAKGTIKEEIERFLAAPKRSGHSLRYLRKKIGQQEKEFIGLFQELKQGLRNIPNTDNLAHKLVLALLKSIKQEKEEIRIEASKILGDLGPVDLNTMVLNNINSYQSGLIQAFQSDSAALTHFLPEIINNLQTLQYEYKPEVANRILKALPSLVHLPQCATLLETRKDLNLFKQSSPLAVESSSSSSVDSQKNISELELFAGFAVNHFSKATFDSWVQGNAKTMLSYLDNTSFYPVVEKAPEFGRQLFPFLVTMILGLEEDRVKHAMEETFNNFFKDFESTLTSTSANTHHHPTIGKPQPLMLNRSLLKLMLDCVEIIRIYNQNAIIQVNLNYLSIASAAQYCHLHAHSILYGELWVVEEKYSRKCSDQDLPLDDLRGIMIPSYEALEVHDAVKPFLDLNHSRHKYYMLENAWEFAYLETTAGIAAKRITRLDTSHNQTGRFSCAQFTELSTNYETIWRLGDWDQLKSIAMSGNQNTDNGYQKSHCLALKSLHLDRSDEVQSKVFLQLTRERVINNIAQSSLDCTKGVYESMTALKQIQQLEDVLQETRDWKAILEKWLRFDTLQANSFEQQEQILVQRISILQSRSGQRGVPSVVEKQMRKTVLELIRLAKDDRNFRAAVTNLKTLENMELDTEIKSRMILEDGHLQFIAGHSKLANHLYLKLINEEEFQETSSRISALLLMAEYLTDNLMVNPSEILQMYLLPAEKLYLAYGKTTSRSGAGSSSVETLQVERVKIYDTTAKFADTIYTQRSNYMKSSEYAEKKKLHEASKAEFSSIDTSRLDVTAKTRIHTLRQTIILEQNQLKTVTEEREKYLHLAIKSYTRSCVMNGDLNDLQICRIVSLWFTNISDAFTGDFLQKNLPDIPSYKFLMILPQIAARLSHSDQVLTKTISEALVRCCQQHPHHSIYHVLALYNAHADSKNVVISSSMETRISNTKLIMKKLMADKAVGKIVVAAQSLGIALIKLANREQQDTQDTKVGQELMGLGDMFHIAAPTADLPVLINRSYATIPYIVSWVPRFQMVGGINCPKKLEFLCSDGVSRSMLVKGKDDLRQDAVMQQVFHFMNVLLKNKKSSCKRNLSIRTYKIVPLTQMSGILEFCDNTNTLGNYLVTAHERYRPGEPRVNECRKMMVECAKKPPEDKLKQFKAVCKSLSPVFQHFFTENFFSPVEWFEKRMFYINSVATTSMVGYIMGIGDRHVNNILIDKSTAEVIHIDFGIALERGKLLPTPEKVPFRLTRDLVAAMGCFGVDGLFRTSCEITMQVLRENKALINTIVEVFLYDPLYNWVSSSIKKKASAVVPQDDSNDEKNALAARVLIRLNEKLNGRDENDTTAIENQVERLIRQATNPSNQAQMFYGWQPYL